jgi:EipB-like
MTCRLECAPVALATVVLLTVVFLPVASSPLGSAELVALGESSSKVSPLTSHRALYRMTLARSLPSSGIVGANGAMFVHFEEACDGWKSEISTRMLLNYGEEGEVLTEWEFSSWEARDGQRFLFRSVEREGPDNVSEIEGSAILGLGSRAEFVKPSPSAIALPPGTRFPTRHLIDLIEAARHGLTLYSGTLFDASPDSPYFVSTVIGKLRPAELASMGRALGRPDGMAWQMHMAFYPIDSIEQLPSFQITMRYREDGIADRMVQDYGDFTVDVDLDNLDFLPAPSC